MGRPPEQNPEREKLIKKKETFKFPDKKDLKLNSPKESSKEAKNLYRKKNYKEKTIQKKKNYFFNYSVKLQKKNTDNKTWKIMARKKKQRENIFFRNFTFAKVFRAFSSYLTWKRKTEEEKFVKLSIN